MKLARYPLLLPQQLKKAASSEFSSLAVSFKTECRFVDLREANAREIVQAMIRAGGEPIAFIDEETKRHILQGYATSDPRTAVNAFTPSVCHTTGEA